MPRAHPLYYTWANMKARCDNPNRPDYCWYGGRGITYIKRWESFDNWLEDIPARTDGATFDRIDNTKNYEPSNVKWSTPTEQANNRSTNVFYEIDGISKTLADWAHYYELDATGYKRAHERIKNGWNPKRALETPPRKCSKPYRVESV